MGKYASCMFVCLNEHIHFASHAYTSTYIKAGRSPIPRGVLSQTKWNSMFCMGFFFGCLIEIYHGLLQSADSDRLLEQE